MLLDCGMCTLMRSDKRARYAIFEQIAAKRFSSGKMICLEISSRNNSLRTLNSNKHNKLMTLKCPITPSRVPRFCKLNLFYSQLNKKMR